MSADNFGALGADFFIRTFNKGSLMSQSDLDQLIQYVQLTTTIMAVGEFTPGVQDSVWMILERVDVPSAPGYTVTNNTDVTMTSGGMVTIDSMPWTKITGKPALFSGSYTDLTDKPAAQILQAPQWNTLHNLGTGNRYLVGDLVYDNGTIYQAILTNESQYTAVGDATYWRNLGSGIRLQTDYLDLANKPTIPTSFSSLVNGANTVSLGTDGSLTLPSAGKIVNNSNEWTFDTDGDLTAPRNIILNNPVTTVTESVTGTVADSNGNPFTFRILKADNPQLITPFADPNFVLKWTGTDAGSVAAAAQAPGGQGASSLVSDDGTYWNFNSWFGLNQSRPNSGTVFTVEYGVVVSDTTISTTETNLVIEANTKQYKFGTDGNLTLPSGGDIVDSTGTSVFDSRVTKVNSSWTVTPGTNTYSFTLDINSTYNVWVGGNIPNGIITYVATISITNSNVPVIGTQYAWNYTGAGNPILLTSIPNQVIGTAGTISTDTVATTTSNRFDFGISNTSGSNQTVYWGYTKIS